MSDRAITFISVLLITTPAFGASKPDPNGWMKNYPLHMGSHVQTVAKPKGAMASLSLDGKVVAKDAVRFELNLSGTVEGVPMAAIWADRGGASCYDGSELLFAAPAGKPVVQDKVEGTACQAKPKVAEANGQLVVVNPPVAAKPEDATPAVAGDPGEVWLFDATHGAQRAMAIGPEGPDME